MVRLLAWLLLLPVALFASGTTGAQKLEEILATKLDPQQCYRVRDIFIEREDVKFYLTDGLLIFAAPLNGRTIAAFFIAESPTDQGEILVLPPTTGERQSVARFTSEPVLNEKFRSAMMFFTDDTAEVLHKALESSKSSRPEATEGAGLATRWNPVLKNLLESTALRILFDLLSESPRENGFFMGIVGGSRLGRFDVAVDSQQRRQVTIGQSVWHENSHYFETWCSFPGHSFRQGDRKQTEPPGRLDDYRIESRISPDLLLDVVAKATFIPETSENRAFALELSEELYVKKVLLDGQPIEFLQLDQPVSSFARRRQNNLIMLILPEDPPPDARYELEMQYEGKVISETEEGIYYVGSRGSWYPKNRSGFANFDFTFHYPAELDLVATAEQVETAVEGDVRTSRFRTASPIRIAGFNLGRYERASEQVDDYTVEVCANREVESSLNPAQQQIILIEPPSARNRPFGRTTASSIITPAPLVELRASDRIHEVAASSAAAVKRLVDWFGAPATRHIIISPVPGNFGQGFPGLVYASTLSYFRADDPPLKSRAPQQQVFYADLLRAHEISHQWWGNVISIDEESDIWLMEALATYSALMLLEQNKGIVARDAVLAGYKQDLLTANQDGATMESAGPVVLGYRLRSSKFPEAPQIIMYEKGAWILHMLRNIMSDQKFLQFLRGLRSRYEFKTITTDDFRREAAQYLPQDWPDPKLEVFFDQWVYGTGIPKYTIQYHTKGKAPQIQFQARVRQQGVSGHFTAVVPVRIETVPGRSALQQVRIDGPETELNLVLRNPPSRVTLDPDKMLLAIIE